MNPHDLSDWIRTALTDLGWGHDFMLDQIRLVEIGVRDGRLHDHTCHLIGIIYPEE